MDSPDRAIAQLRQSAAESKLVIVAGTGLSIALTSGLEPQLSWSGLVDSGFDYALKKSKITESQKESWKTQLHSEDLDDLLSAAEFVGRKLGAPNGDLYARWLQGEFEHVVPKNYELSHALKAIYDVGIPFSTLNYDTLIERCLNIPSVDLLETKSASAWFRREKPGVLHLHGRWDNPKSCVLGIRDYETTVEDSVRDLFQRGLSTFNRLLFIGAGGTFGDPNFSALVAWLRRNISTAAPQHYALVTASEVASRHADPAWQGFVEPIPFGGDFDLLPKFLTELFPSTSVRPPRSSRPKRAPRANDASAQVLAAYKEYLIKDCGQMTIEGVRADMDTAQRRFDLEKLFVPLHVRPIPPDVPINDPNRDLKLQQWEEKNKDARPFGKEFLRHKRIALLALPGGGKTLLLKRLVVAYAEESRRNKSEDELPDLALTPVLIRCREWREHIRRPIPEILGSIPEISGLPNLKGLREALVPLLKSGKVLLLVDGLDEIHSDADRTTFVEHLESFLEEYGKIRVVVTSREAGFGLVAPTLIRFCTRLRVAPLSRQAIIALCDHWHDLMSGGSPEALADGRDVASALLASDALHRLAENPLLLTMLLVVKHGAGRLPPDRVSLYDRAVDVLLDTWNIKGHDSLRTKEAVPQLACVAFEMMRLGQQTATEEELLRILEEARDSLPQIRRYASGTPDEFLKRVELRSGLLVEAGHRLDGIKTVPFYQFRHLTFQEYLAAVAAAEGYYISYRKGQTVLSPLEEYLTAEEWKEVIPMAAVLGKKQAEPLIDALVARSASLREQLKVDLHSNDEDSRVVGSKLPATVSRLVQCLVEEAQVSSEILPSALQIVAIFAHGCQSADNWQALSRGPYGEELLHQAWLVYSSGEWPRASWVRNTLARLSAFRESEEFWWSKDGQTQIEEYLGSDSAELVTRGLLTCAGAWWGGQFAGGLHRRGEKVRFSDSVCLGIEAALFSRDPPTAHAATWTWAIVRRVQETPVPHVRILDRLVELFLSSFSLETDLSAADFAIVNLEQLPVGHWVPTLGLGQEKCLCDILTSEKSVNYEREYRRVASAVILYYANSISKDKLKAYLSKTLSKEPTIRVTSKIDWLLDEVGVRIDRSRRPKAVQARPITRKPQKFAPGKD